MKIKSIVGVLIVGMLFAVSVAAVGDNRGAEEMVLQGGKLGSVPFPHHKHQEALEACKDCHNIFPKVAGSVEDLKVQGKLEKKRVMNECRGCHKEKAGKGEKAGPTKCKACHQK